MGETEFLVTRSDPNELKHYGILGMRWGRRRYQNKDGSLTNAGRKHYDKETEKLKAEKKLLKNRARTQKKVDKVKDLRAEVDDLKKADEEAKQGESREEKRKRLLESTDAKEIYENRNLLTTAELNDRINRIDTEARLAAKIPEKQTGLDYINGKMNKASNTINSATNMFQKVDNAYSTVSKSAIGKVVAKKLGIEPPKKAFDYDDFIKNIASKTTQEVKDAAARSTSEKLLRNNASEFKDRKSSSQSSNSSNDTGRQQYEDYNKNWYENDRKQNGSYSMKGDSVVDSKVGTGSRNTTSNPRIETVERVSGTVEGRGISRAESTGRSYVDDSPAWRDVSSNSTNYSDAASIGQNYIAGYLTDKKK